MMRIRFRRGASFSCGFSGTESLRQQSLLETRSRSGSLFHYYLVYLMLSGTTLAACGLFLHIILKSDYSHDQNAQQLQTLMRMEKRLRADAADAVRAEVKDGQLVFSLQNEAESVKSESSEKTGVASTSDAATIDGEITRVRWKFQGHRVSRGILSAGGSEGKPEKEEEEDALEIRKMSAIDDNFVFLTGTDVQIQSRVDHGAIVIFRELSLTSGKALPASAGGMGNRNTGLGVVEIVLGPGQYGFHGETVATGGAQ